MGELGIISLLALVVIVGVPVAILAGAIVYVVRLARRGTQATLADAAKRRELA
ncbi:hypothetical protein LG943_09120 [Streptomonospora sp. S1-112]|uniref:Uncharacterized protein n=1 Tax=Streptomonospora mangrovi TaxID=2883123 RepID=A0A9X3NPU6_9ACTN|nr:hypothetical protein [Streptomonospora mangrovi]MDA0564485.1 hypothetical protein [Streptomonospora mangrovi]